MAGHKREEELFWTEISQLDKEIEELKKKKEECENKIKDLLFKEKPSDGIYHHQELFELQQKKLMIQVEIDYRQKKKNRRLWYLKELK